jgi:hypothetical protein
MIHRFNEVRDGVFSVWRRFARLGLQLAIGLSLGSAIQASTVPRLAFEELTRSAGRIAHARCVRTSAFLDPESGMIWTQNYFEVEEMLKGQAEAHQLVVTEPGGVVGNLGQAVSGAPRFKPGDEAVLFLAQTKGGKWRVRGWGQGNYRVTRDPATGESLVQPDLAGLELVETAAPAAQDTGAAMRRQGGRGESLDQFKQRIRAQLAR